MINTLIHIHPAKKDMCWLIVYLDEELPTNIFNQILILLKAKRK